MATDSMVKIFKNERNRSLFVTIVVVVSVTLGTSFGIYNTSVVNNLKPAVVTGSGASVHSGNWSAAAAASAASMVNGTSSGGYGRSARQGPSEITWSLLVAAFSIGSGLSTLTAPIVAETVGRKTGLLLSALLNIAGGVMCALYHLWFELAIVGRFFIGAAFGVGVPLAAMFVTEIAPTKWRGACNAAMQAGAATGDALGMTLSLPQVLGSNRYSNLALGFTAITSFVMLIVVTFAHESPRALILSSDDEKRGLKSLQFYLGREEAKKTFDSLLVEKLSRKKEKLSLKNALQLFRRAPVKALALAATALTIQMLSGVSVIMGYSTDMFMASGLSLDAATRSTLVLGFCNFVTSFISVRLIERLGRRRLLLVGLIGTTLGTWSFTGFSLLFSYNGDRWPPATAYSMVASLAVYALSYSFLSAGGATIAAEVCDQSYRSIALSFGYFVSLMVSTLTVLTYEPIKTYLGLSWVLFPFSCLALPLTIVLYVCVAETSGVDLEKIRV